MTSNKDEAAAHLVLHPILSVNAQGYPQKWWITLGALSTHASARITKFVKHELNDRKMTKKRKIFMPHIR